MTRIYHTWDRWECYPAGFYESVPKGGIKREDCQRLYSEFLRDSDEFESALIRVLSEWPNSCEHYLSNENMNRIAWLGQASLCIARGIPACYRGGFNMLAENEQRTADALALRYLNQWLEARGEPPHTIETAASKTKADLY